MKKKSLKIIASVVLILVLLAPYMQSVASSIIPLGQKSLGAKGDAKVIKSVSFKGGAEATTTVPASNTTYDKAGYYKYITSLSGVTPPSGANAGEIYIRNIEGDNENDANSAFYCLNPTKPFPPSASGTNYVSKGLLSELTDAELSALLNKATTKAQLDSLLQKFYLGETLPQSAILNKIEKEQKDRVVSILVDAANSSDKIYQYLTDDDIKVAQQWALWQLTSNASLSSSPDVKRDLSDTGSDDTPLGTGGYKSDRNAFFFDLSNNFSTVPNKTVNNTSLVKDLSEVPFTDEGVDYVDIGTFKISTTRPDLLTSIKLFNQSNADITESTDYEILIGPKSTMGGDFATPVPGTLSANLTNASLLNRDFFLRFKNPNTITKIRMELSFVRDSKIEAEIFEANDNNHQNIIKLHRIPEVVTRDAEFERPDLITDIALRKFITKINDQDVDTRVPVVTEQNEAINKGTQTTAHYAHKKNPLIVELGDTITYNMRIYNESTKPATPTSVVDILPKGLSLKTGTGINDGWSVVETLSDGREVLIYQPIAGTPIPAATQDADGNYEINFVEISVDILVDMDAPTGLELTNISYVNTQDEGDIDSKPGRLSKDGLNDIYSITNDQLPEYRGYGNDGQTLDQPSGYYKGYEDDDDFEKVILRPFDLALRKFITKINATDVTPSREPDSDVTKLVDGIATTATYTHPKNPLEVEKGDLVTYKIRVYNEGGVDGYVKQIADHLPEGLGYIINHRTNLDNEWFLVGSQLQLTEVEKAGMPFLAKIDLTKIAKEDSPGVYSDTETASSVSEIDIIKGKIEIATKIAETHLLSAFNEEQGAAGLSYVDVEVVSVVLEDLKSINLKNWAEIKEHSDKNNIPIKDRDSVPGNLSEHPEGPYEDDEDFEDLMTKYFDLALRKFITNVNDDGDANTSGDAVDREPRVDVTKLVDGTATTAEYRHPKTPVEVKKGDLVTYKIRVYNEGQIDGYVKEITDHLPKGLGFLPQHKKNINNGWEIIDGTESTAANFADIDFKFRAADLEGVADLANTVIAVGAEVKTKLRENALIAKFVPENGADGLSYVDVDIVCVVLEDRELNASNSYIGNLKNWAEITKHTDGENNPITDRDSVPGNLSEHPEGPYEDDEDFEDLTTKALIFDLALQKFITQIHSEAEARAKTPEQLKDRQPVPVIDADGKIKYTKKDTEPPLVGVGDTVVYTIRVYNEGDIAGYAKRVRDTLPEGLTYLPDNDINKKYDWKFIDADGNAVDDITKAKFVETDYLSREKAIERETAGQQPNRENTILLPFDKTIGTIHARDVQIVFKVNELAKPGVNNLKNIAEISDDEDEDGNIVEDKDSTPGNEKPDEDDIDDENLKVTYFDLALLKIVTNVELTENGKTKNIKTGHTFEMIPEPIVKTDLDERYLSTTKIKYTYKIRVYNQGVVEGYATKVADYIPKGLEFYPEDQKNNKWTEVEKGLVQTTDLADKVIKPGEFQTVEIVLRWINHKNNMGVKTNVAEIAEDHNEYNLPDIDSVPGNRKPGEDDIDDASVVVAIRTGASATFFAISITMATIVGTGTYLIKRFVI